MATTAPVQYLVLTPEERVVIARDFLRQREDTFLRSSLADPEGPESESLRPQRAELDRLQKVVKDFESEADATT